VSLFRRAVEQRAWTADPIIPPNSQSGVWSSAGVSVTADSVLRIATVYGCVRILADAVASTPLYVYEYDGQIKKRTTDPVLAERLQNLFVDMNGDVMPTWNGIYRWMTSMAIRGNAFSAVVARDGRYPTALTPLHPEDVKTKLIKDGSVVHGWEWEVNRHKIPTEDLVHIPLMVSGASPLGLSPLEARETFGLALAAQEFGSLFFSQGATVSGVIEVDGAMTADDAKVMAASWSQSHGGLSKSHIPAVLTGGATFRPISVTPEQAQFLETRAFQRTDIMALFGVPPHMLGDTDKSTSWGTGIEQQSIGFIRYTLRPYLKRIEQTLSAMLPPQYFVRFDLSDLLQADTTTRFAAYQTARTAGFLSLNEIRQKEDLAPVPEFGDDYLLPLNSALNGADLSTLTGNNPPVEGTTP
jgi:HK97 family phage portal protein